MASTVTGLPQARASCLRMGVSRIQMGCTEGGVSVSAIITLHSRKNKLLVGLCPSISFFLTSPRIIGTSRKLRSYAGDSGHSLCLPEKYTAATRPLRKRLYF